MKSFEFSRSPELIFGEGTFQYIPDILRVKGWGTAALFIGGNSFAKSGQMNLLLSALESAGISCRIFSSSGEPGPGLIDDTVEKMKSSPPDVILAIGGGSVIDTAKAVSAMLMEKYPISDFLEGIGNKIPSGRRLPLIAVPTTSGTGSQATKNAVISRSGDKGFKKSLRHDGYIPDIAVLDPGLMLSCPPSVTAASGLDAVTQLLEGYVSTQGNMMTESLALGGLKAAAESIERAVFDGNDIDARSKMAYASYASGLVLANAGLGIVHGIASAAGGLFHIPHGVVCGTLVGKATRVIIERLRESGADGTRALLLYGRAGVVVTGTDSGSDYQNALLLSERLDKWISDFGIPGLRRFGINKNNLKNIAEKSRIKNTPAGLGFNDILEILESRA